MRWIEGRNLWQGECPRCGVSSFFALTASNVFSDGSVFDVVECPGQSHPFVICTPHSSRRTTILFIAPVSGDANIPTWLPVEYANAYSEMMFDFKSKKYRSAVAIAGIILDCHINSLLLHSRDKRKPLAHRMELLVKWGKLDADQFAEGTVGRLERNDAIHPEGIAVEVEEAEAQEAIDAVTGCLERFYKFRRAKALPAPTEQIGESGEEIEKTPGD